MSDQSVRDEPTWMRWHDESMPVRVGVSACLLGGEVRFDGGHKRDRYLTDVLGDNVDWLPVCPEIELGMGIPRPVIQLRGGEIGDRLVTRETDEDWTDRMKQYADARTSELADVGLDGFVLKKDSPSCGMTRVRVYGRPGGMPSQNGVGHFAQALNRGMPDLPMEEEGRLRDAVLIIQQDRHLAVPFDTRHGFDHNTLLIGRRHDIHTTQSIDDAVKRSRLRLAVKRSWPSIVLD